MHRVIPSDGAIRRAMRDDTDDTSEDSGNEDDQNPLVSQKPYRISRYDHNLESKITRAYKNNQLTDVEFLVGGAETRILANKTILSLQSPVFTAMFFNRWASSSGEGITSENVPSTSKDPRLVQVKLPDIEPTPFRSFLKFLYTEELETTIVHVAQVLHISKKYQVDELSKACLNFVRNNVRASNAIPLLADAKRIVDPVLEHFTLRFIRRYPFEVFASESFFLLSQEELAKFLEQQDLIINEVLLFQSVWRWAQNECFRKMIEPNSENRRHVLGSAFKSIRFLQMNAEDFVTNVSKLKIFTAEEENEIFRYICLPGNLRTTAPETEFMESLMGPRKTRHIVTRVERSDPRACWMGTISRYDYIRTDDRNPATSKFYQRMEREDRTCNHCFQINRPAALVSCGFFGPKKITTDKLCYTVSVLLRNEDCDYTFASLNETVFVQRTAATNKDIFRVSFKHPVSLAPDVWYTISYILQGRVTVAGNNKPKYQVKTDGNDPAVIKFKDASESNALNQLPELCFEF